jgi:molecular chaperone GrpE
MELSRLLPPWWGLCIFCVPELGKHMTLNRNSDHESAGESRANLPNDQVVEKEIGSEPEEELSAESIADLKAAAATAAEHWDRLLRARADLENYRKRAVRERQEAVQAAQVALLERLLPALDSLDMAMTATNSAEGENWEALKTGVSLVHQQLKTTLAEAGLDEIDATRQVFDPNVHEALSQMESAEVPEGHVLQQIRKGYKFRDRLVRPASVVVAKPPVA